MVVKKGKGSPSNKARNETPDLVNNAHYVKDLSFENPGILKNISMDQVPDINININVDVTPVGDAVYEVLILTNIKADSKGESLFLVELAYGGIFHVNADLTDEKKKKLLLVDAPTLLFPFARAVIANLTREGGLPPLMLNPVDFETLSQQAVDKSEIAKH